MRGFGPIALIGGSEHREGCEPIDRWLMEQAGRGSVKVTVVPAASSARKLPATAALARNYWTALGAHVALAIPASGSERALDALAEPDLIVLTGGFPDRIITSLGASTLWDRILELWADGAGISGSSAGSMALFEWRLRLLPPHPLRLIPGLGPLGEYLSLPHFDRYIGDRHGRRLWVRRMAASLRGLGVIGLDEATALVGRDGRYGVLGRGSVSLLHQGAWQAYPSGAAVDIEMGQKPGLYPVAASSADAA